MSWQVIEYGRPKDEGNCNPNVFSRRAVKISVENIPQNNEHESDINKHSQQAKWEQSFKLSNFWKKEKNSEQGKGKKYSKDRVYFFD